MPECATNPTIEFFEANAFIGRPVRGSSKSVGSAAELLREMDESGTGRALVWHIDQFSCHPTLGNGLIDAAVAESDRLFGCWTIMPPQADHVIESSFFSRMREHRAVALRAFPSHHHYLLNRQVFGGFLDEVTERRIPLMLSITDSPVGGTTWSSVYELMRDYPELTCILCDCGIWQTDRYTRPLLENYPNLCLETSYLAGPRVVEEMVANYGAHRLVFGSGFPLRYPEAPMLQLLHLEISDDDKRQVASANLDRIVSGVRL